LSVCISTGGTREECERNIREAIELHLEGMREEGLPIPAPISEAGQVEVAA
jgi:predicted RNase H-like HicB family nuclease